MTVRVRRRGAAGFAEGVETLTAGLREGEARAQKLLGLPASDAEHALLRQCLGELRIHHEELTVAEEQLRAQLDELGRLELRVDAERERYAELFERAPDPYLVTDRLGVIREANAGFSRLVHVEARFLRTKPITAFLSGPDVKAVHGLLEALDRPPPEGLDFTLRPRGGGAVPVAVHLSLASRDQRVLWSFRPVVGERRASIPPSDLERALRDKEDLLERERRAREELERSDRAKDRFIAVLSHDLRAPLNAILGWTQLLRREVLDQAARIRAVETIERNAKTQASLIEELLDVSRMAADKVQLALGPVDVGAVAQRIVEGALPQAKEIGLELTITVEPDLTVVCDRQRLEQVMTNLISNAMKYTPAPGTVQVEAKRDGRWAELCVRDSGQGIDATLLPHVFELYTQEQKYSTSRTGLGLGLYIVKQLVELHDGSVEAESEGVGRGSRFTVRLPLNDSIPPLASEHAIEPAVALRDVRVLVVDDEEDARELLATILRRAGADVACAAGMNSAIDVFDGWAPDVVVSDLAMPGGDGCELVRVIRRRDPSVAAVAVSGFTTDVDADRALAAGFDAHIGKPIDGAEIVEAVYSAARRRHV